MSRSARIVFTVVMVTGIVAVLAGLVIVLVIRPMLNRPAAAPPILPVAEEYLNAVANGDATAALAMTDLDTGRFDGASTGLLGDDVLRGATERITDPRVEDVQTSGYGGYRATTTITFTLMGEAHEAELTWAYDEDVEEWHVVGGLLATVTFEGLGGDAVPVEVAGVTPDPTAECHGPCTSANAASIMFVGAYEVQADLSGFVVHPDNTTPTDLLITVKPGTADRVQYLARPEGKPWPTVDGNPTDPEPVED